MPAQAFSDTRSACNTSGKSRSTESEMRCASLMRGASADRRGPVGSPRQRRATSAENAICVFGLLAARTSGGPSAASLEKHAVESAVRPPYSSHLSAATTRPPTRLSEVSESERSDAL
jgi:hypothetical protein